MLQRTRASRGICLVVLFLFIAVACAQQPNAVNATLPAGNATTLVGKNNNTNNAGTVFGVDVVDNSETLPASYSAHGSSGMDNMFSIMCALLSGTLFHFVFQEVNVPYSVILLGIGIAAGLIATEWEVMASFAELGDIEPHFLLYAFLPLLIFESAFTLNFHIIRKEVGVGCLRVLSSRCNVCSTFHLSFRQIPDYNDNDAPLHNVPLFCCVSALRISHPFALTQLHVFDRVFCCSRYPA
jgi:hypothetical protein